MIDDWRQLSGQLDIVIFIHPIPVATPIPVPLQLPIQIIDADTSECSLMFTPSTQLYAF